MRSVKISKMLPLSWVGAAIWLWILWVSQHYSSYSELKCQWTAPVIRQPMLCYLCSIFTQCLVLTFSHSMCPTEFSIGKKVKEMLNKTYMPPGYPILLMHSHLMWLFGGGRLPYLNSFTLTGGISGAPNKK